MSASSDETYLNLCNQFAERSRRLTIDELNFSDDETEESFDNVLPSSFHYIWIVGKRSDSELMWAVEEEVLYVSNGKIIAKDQAEAYTCNVKGCTSRVYLKPNGVAYKVAEHSVLHGSMYGTYMELQCRNYMREECKIAGASKSVTDIFEEAVLLWNNDPNCEGPFPIQYSTIKRTLADLRKKKYDKSPNSCTEIKKAFENPVILKDLGTSLYRGHGKLFNYVHEEDKFSYCVFISPKSIELIMNNLEASERFYLIDGTFRITPMCNVFKQVLIIHAQFGIKSFPLVNILMSCRTTDAYVHALNYLHTNVLPLCAKGIISDFELALRNALRKVVPETPLISCWFHHCQCLRRNIASNSELFKLIRSDKKAFEFYRTFQCLALLPDTKIENAFVQVAHEALKSFPQFESFVRYYEKQWIKQETPSNYSVFLKDTRTTGQAEAHNGKCNRSFKTHGNLFNFLTVFQREEAIKTNELERDVSGLIQKDTRKRKFKDRSLIIEHYSRQFRDEKISVTRFLKTMINMDNKVVFQEHEYPTLDLDEIDFINTEEREKMRALLGKPNGNDQDPVVMSTYNDDCEVVSIQTKPHQTKRQITIEESVRLTRSKARKRMASETQPTASTSSFQNAFSMHRSKRTRTDVPVNDIESSSSDLQAVTELTSTTDEISRLHKKFDEIISSSETIKLHKSKCIMGCDREKATVLLPCSHQPTCNQCFVLYKIYLSERNKKIVCPFCKVDVANHIAINNE